MMAQGQPQGRKDFQGDHELCCGGGHRGQGCPCRVQVGGVFLPGRLRAQAERAGGESSRSVPAPGVGLPGPGWYSLYCALSCALEG